MFKTLAFILKIIRDINKMEESTLHSINIEERFIIDEPISEINLNKKFKKNNEFKEHTSFNNSFSNKNHHVNNDEYEKKITKILS